MKLFPIILIFMIMASIVGRYNTVSAYFTDTSLVSIKNTTGDWTTPQLTISKKVNQEKTIIKEIIKNGSFSETFNSWQKEGNVAIQDIENQLPPISTTAAVLRNQGILKQKLPPHDIYTLQFALKIITNESTLPFAEYAFQVQTDNQVIYEFTVIDSDWQHHYVELPKSNEQQLVQLKLVPISNIIKPVQVLITDISTLSANLQANQTILFESDERDTTMCLRIINQVNEECHRMPFEKHFDQDQKSVNTITLSDLAGNVRNMYLGINKDSVVPIKPEISQVFVETEQQVLLFLQQNVSELENMFLEVGLATEADSTYVWNSEMFNWLEANYISHNLLTHNVTQHLKLIKNVDNESKWMKIRVRDEVGNRSNESLPHQFR